MRAFFLVVVILLANHVFSQKKLIDSLEKRVKEASSDTSRLYFMINLSNVCDVADIKKYVEPALELIAQMESKENSASLKEKILAYKALAYSNLGYLYDMQGSVGPALDYYQKSLTIFLSIKSEKEAAYNYSNMAYVYDHQGDIQKASDYYTKALEMLLRIGDKYGAANVIHNMGNLYYRKKDLKRTFQYYMRSLELHEELKDKRGIAGALNSLSSLMIEQNNKEKALEYIKRSLVLTRDVEDEFVRTSTYIASGNVYKGLKQYKIARMYLDTGLALAKQYGFPEQIESAESHLAAVYGAMGDHKASLEHYKQFIIFKDSLSNDETRRMSIKNQFKFDFERKETILKEQQEKERIIAESKHRFQQVIIYSVIGGLLLVIGFSLFIFRSLQQNKKANIIISQQKKEVEEQKNLVEEKQHEILDSINYAKRIQYTLLAHDEFLKENLKEYFVYFNPKDIVSGDFYWAAKHGTKFYLAVCDSTGHGVPGAFMSLLNIGFLSEAIKEKGILKPNAIFNYVRERLIETVSRDGQRDGFDGILVCFDSASKKITYAAANNTPVVISNGQLNILEADRMPVGKGERGSEFTLYETELKPGDILYVYTDGYADQFGGPKGKKFKYKQLNEVLLQYSSKPLADQKMLVQNVFHSWKANLEQVDDVCIIGVRA